MEAPYSQKEARTAASSGRTLFPLFQPAFGRSVLWSEEEGKEERGRRSGPAISPQGLERLVIRKAKEKGPDGNWARFPKKRPKHFANATGKKCSRRKNDRNITTALVCG
ncbi:unnamed protein product [Bursaphelenchus xylophilus]|uniref:(pine wood nematode) hypothetical protein n=1 Tax=Bursaphelenchus xylophilus TaxID=6326 RepID=A0A1I7SF70_BURXY|nr:unnamed protein product [Bursaphelenchus xylophilus]CAG9130500.1 unnamed protein product [Bursaphelenchus xylophilus]